VEVADDRRRRRPGGRHLGDGVEGDPADGHHRRRQRGRHLGQHGEAARGRLDLLAARLEDGPEADVIGAGGQRRQAVGQGAGGAADQPVRPDHAADLGHREVLLADVHAIRLGQGGHVGPVVDDDEGPPGREGHEPPGDLEQLAGRDVLQAELDDARAARQHRLGLGQRGLPAHDGVEPSEAGQARGAYGRGGEGGRHGPMGGSTPLDGPARRRILSRASSGFQRFTTWQRRTR
jgi:hypothetical protein